jgi:hypothetical protein
MMLPQPNQRMGKAKNGDILCQLIRHPTFPQNIWGGKPQVAQKPRRKRVKAYRIVRWTLADEK